MMVKFRPHRGGLKEALAEAREFNTVEEMYQYIEDKEKDLLDYFEKHRNHLVGEDLCHQRIYIDKEALYDERCGWNTRYVCSYGNCIGMCDLGDYVE